MDQAEVRLRLAALDQAVKVVVSHEARADDVVSLAQRMYDWVSAEPTAVRLDLVVGEITKQGQQKETSVQIHDDEQFTLTVHAKDAKGFDTTDANLEWTSSDESVVTLQVADDKQSAVVVGGNPGSAVVTLSDGNLSVTEAVDVVPAGAATIALVEGAPEPQPVGEPAPTPADTTTTEPAPAPGETVTTTEPTSSTDAAAPADATAPTPTPDVTGTTEPNPAGDTAV
jgi:hypothetical protein